MSKTSAKEKGTSPNGSPGAKGSPADAPEAAGALALPSPATFPVDSLREAAQHLRRPFTAEAVKWKVQTGTLVVPYVDARLVIERLNMVVPHLWFDEYEPTPKGLMWCHLTIGDITRHDVGQGRDKGLVSDALKRAAVKFGVAVSLYALPKINLEVKKAQLQKDGKGFAITEKGLNDLAAGYRKWLEETGEPRFGPALDHGDVADALGDVEAETDETSEAAPEDSEPAKLDDAKAQALIDGAEKLYEDLPKAAKTGKGGLTPATFRRKLEAAWHSHDELGKLVADLEKRGKDG